MPANFCEVVLVIARWSGCIWRGFARIVSRARKWSGSTVVEANNHAKLHHWGIRIITITLNWKYNALLVHWATSGEGHGGTVHPYKFPLLAYSNNRNKLPRAKLSRAFTSDVKDLGISLPGGVTSPPS